MKKYIILLLTAIILSGCGVTYYIYYEVESPEAATVVSKQDGIWAKNRKSPTRVIATYPDSTGKTVYLMESKTKEKITYIEE
jgi:hypothetical protein